MNWKLKAHTLALLSRIPGGSSIYHRLQKVAGTNRLQLDRDLERAFELIDLVQECGESVEGKAIFEIGTGWRPLVPMVMSLAGADRVATVDVNPWLTFDYAKETWAALGDRIPEIAARCQQTESEVAARYRAVPESAETLEDLLSSLAIEYVYPGDSRTTNLPADSIDVVLSSNVLEHIPYDIQLEIHAEALRILKPRGLSVHRFNPQDHYSTVDSSITNAHFLQFSEEQWHWYGGSGLAYHNRLRSRQYREMFDRLGYKKEVFRERVDQRTVHALRSGNLPVAECFNRFTVEELAVDYIWVALRKPSVPAVSGKQSASSGSSLETAKPGA